ncbi:MAG: NUDIX domain-containing protein [Patescibacteria group bacterium]|nr:NUDIX domain-containing protein [Patescibacteria group bacterium]MDD4304402.1 NUDIX domain-containing protein [Patescibacteria group bacterium]MDD4695425.1 NUDIX domain-containing protein [Patescibacteria group bacterium]
MINENIMLQVGVKILLKNKENKYLLLRRSLEKYPETKNTGRWDIVGGRIESGITLLENLKREIKEETGLEFTDSPKFIGAQDILIVPGHHIVRLSYTGNIDGEVRIDEDHDMYRWFSKEELINLEDINIYFKELLDSKAFLL